MSRVNELYPAVVAYSLSPEYPKPHFLTPPSPVVVIYPLGEGGVARIGATLPPRPSSSTIPPEEGGGVRISRAGDWIDFPFHLVEIQRSARKPPRDRGWAYADEVMEFYRLSVSASSRNIRASAVVPPGVAPEFSPCLFANWWARPVVSGVVVERRVDGGPNTIEISSPYDILRYSSISKALAHDHGEEVDFAKVIDTALSLMVIDGIRVPHYPCPPIEASGVPIRARYTYIPGAEEGEDKSAAEALAGTFEALEALGYTFTVDGMGRLLINPPPGRPWANVEPGDTIPLPEVEEVWLDPEGNLRLAPGQVAGGLEHMGAALHNSGQAPVKVWWPEIELDDRDIYEWHEEASASSAYNRVVVVNRNAYSLVAASDLAPCVSIGLLGRRVGDVSGPIEIAQWPGQQPQCPLGEGDWRSGESFYAGSFSVQAPGLPLDGPLWVSVSAFWYGDQHGDFEGAKPMGTASGMIYAQPNEATRIELWPDMPGPPTGRRAYLYIDVVPIVQGGLLTHVAVFYEASLVYDSIGVPPAGLGNWVYAVLATLSFGGRSWVKSNEKIIAVRDIPSAPSRRALGVITARVNIETVNVGLEGVNAIADAMAAAAQSPWGGTRVRAVVVPRFGLHHLGRVVVCGGKRWKIAGIDYQEEHGGGGLTLKQTLSLEPTP